MNKINSTPDISIVLGSKNRKRLLKATIESIRENGFTGKMEIIVIDGGSTDGTCDWLAKQTDIFTIVQPNYKIVDAEGISVLAHSWGKFMNIAFRFAKAPWIVMVSDDLILAKGSIQNGYDELVTRVGGGEKIGGGAFFFSEYPRFDYYRVINLPNNCININHGFYNKDALISVNYFEEDDYNFYFGDSDIIMRFDALGWKVIPLTNCFAAHLVHKPKIGVEKFSPSMLREQNKFNNKYQFPKPETDFTTAETVTKINVTAFWKAAFINCFLGVLMNMYEKYILSRK